MADGLAAEVELSRRHRVLLDRRIGRLEWPGRVLDIRTVEPAAVGCVEAVTLRQEPFERLWFGVEDLACRAVPAFESPLWI